MILLDFKTDLYHTWNFGNEEKHKDMDIFQQHSRSIQILQNLILRL